MIVRPNGVGPRLQHVVECVARLDGVNTEARDGLQGDTSDDAERAETNTGAMEEFRLVVGVDVDHVAVGREHSKTSNLRCDAAVSEARAMGAGTHRAGDRLFVDVAHVGQRQSVPVEFPVELLQRDTGSDRDEAGRGVDVMQLIERANCDVKVGRHGDGGERVTSPHDLDATPFGIGSCDDRC